MTQPLPESSLRNLGAQFRGMLERADQILFITGAGISADSGLPTYRGVGGLYNSQNTDDGIPIEEALSGAMLRQRPEVTWKYLWQIADSARGKTFNLAHRAIAELAQYKPRVWVLTQNIDGFHTAAGSRQGVEIHGNMRGLECLNCGAQIAGEDLQERATPPRCTECAGVLRPDVVLFGEMLPALALETLQRELRRGFDLVVSVGTSSVFPYILEPVYSAARQGILTVEINPSRRTAISDVVDLHLPSRAVEAFEAIGPITSW